MSPTRATPIERRYFAALFRLCSAKNALVIEAAQPGNAVLRLTLSEGGTDLLATGFDDHTAVDDARRAAADDFAADTLSVGIAV